MQPANENKCGHRRRRVSGLRRVLMDALAHRIAVGARRSRLGSTRLRCAQRKARSAPGESSRNMHTVRGGSAGRAGSSRLHGQRMASEREEAGGAGERCQRDQGRYEIDEGRTRRGKRVTRRCIATGPHAQHVGPAVPRIHRQTPSADGHFVVPMRGRCCAASRAQHLMCSGPACGPHRRRILGRLGLRRRRDALCRARRRCSSLSRRRRVRWLGAYDKERHGQMFRRVLACAAQTHPAEQAPARGAANSRQHLSNSQGPWTARAARGART